MNEILFVFISKTEHSSVAETAVVSYPHEIFGEGIFAYIVLKENVEIKNDREFVLDLKALVKSKIAHYAIPHKFQVGFIKCMILTN